jgi:hypothetical protein
VVDGVEGARDVSKRSMKTRGWARYRYAEGGRTCRVKRWGIRCPVGLHYEMHSIRRKHTRTILKKVNAFCDS